MAKNIKAAPKPKKSRAELIAEAEKKAKRTRLALIIFAISAVLIISAVIVVSAILSKRAKEILRPMEDNLNKYISISEDDYKNFPVTIKSEPIDELAVENALIQALYAAKSPDTEQGSGIHNISGTEPKRALAAGDIVYAYYLGYYLDEAGRKIYFDGSSNLGATSSDKKRIGIGEGNLYTGFELGLIGKNPWSFDAITLKNGGKVEAGDAVCFTMTAMYSDGSGVATESFVAVTDKAGCDAKYGTGFTDFLMGRGIGKIAESFTTNEVSDKSGSSVYTDIEITAIYKRGMLPMTVSARVPVNDTETGLAGETVYFEVYVDKVQYYSTPEINADFVTKKLNMTMDELMAYGKEGDSIEDCYRVYLEERLKATARDSAENTILEAFWAHVNEKVKVKRLPKGTVNEYYSDYLVSLADEFSGSKGSGFSSLDEYACFALELEEGADWRAHVMELAKQSVTEKIIFYYVIREENFFPTDEEYKEIYDRLVDEMLTEYLASQKITESSFDTKEEYESEVERSRQAIIEAYGAQYFDDNILYEYGIGKILGLASVTYQ